jgi:uncharacterized membrane protein
MSKNRLEAFSDGMLTIFITIMVLDLKAPQGTSLVDLVQILPGLAAYILSFVYLAIYWNNHHHLFHAVSSVNGRVLWSNLHLMFWLSLVSFCTRWMAFSHFAGIPVALYGVVLLMAAIAYFLLTRTLLSLHEGSALLSEAVGKMAKERISILLYALGVGLAFVQTWISFVMYVVVAVMWVVPDSRIERRIER